jgi:hypothetical protein
MIRTLMIAAMVCLISTTASAKKKDFDPYTGQTIDAGQDVQTSSYQSGSTPSQETLSASAMGLTPGFWKNVKRKLYAWTDYTPEDSFNATFGVDDPRGDDLTLLDALNSNGGGNSYPRMSSAVTAAILNVANPQVNYAYTLAEIVADVQNAYLTGQFEAVKNKYDAANNAGGEISKP